MSEVPEEESQSKEAVVLTEDQEKNKHILLALLEDKGIDLEGEFGLESFVSMFKAMSDPEFMTEVFKTIGDMSGGGGDGAAGIKSIAELLGVADGINNDAITESENDRESVVSSNDIGGVDGTAVTYVTPDKPADVQIEGTSVIKDAMEDGSTVVAGSFNNNVIAEGVQVNATIEQNVISTDVSIPVDLELGGQQATNVM